ncbi:MAG: signal recognition particle protein Srp19 [Thermoprotei archaeon]|nr:MAG: signal recognition particle protein Srp19 [Thermoprotei archaeon]
MLGDRDRVIIYPCYFDSTKSEAKGRKVPKKLAFPSPKIDEIFQAAQELNLDPIIEDKPHPSWWWEETSRISIRKVASKRKLLLMLAQKILEKRRKRT